jgi:CrcB protein
MPNKFEPYLLIAAGGFAGACARYAFNGSVPGIYGILAVNVIGCYLLGFLMYESIYIGAFCPQTRLVYGIGFIGSLTTFSTFSFMTFEASPFMALFNVLSSISLGVAGVFLGRMTAIILSRRRSWRR